MRLSNPTFSFSNQQVENVKMFDKEKDNSEKERERERGERGEEKERLK